MNPVAGKGFCTSSIPHPTGCCYTLGCVRICGCDGFFVFAFSRTVAPKYIEAEEFPPELCSIGCEYVRQDTRFLTELTALSVG